MRRLLTGSGRAALATGLIGLGLGAAPAAQASDDGYLNVFSSVLGAVGVIKPDAPPEIEYRERAPLVLPPQDTLPAPVPAQGRKTAAWPQDPDVVRRRKDAEEARAPRKQIANDGVELLTSSELAKGRAQGQADAVPEARNGCITSRNTRNCLVLSPDELNAEGERFRASNKETSDVVTAGQEPDRKYLTQPPRGYMKATRTVKATAEAPAQKLDPANPRSFLFPERKDDE